MLFSRCYERLQTKNKEFTQPNTKEFTHLSYTELFLLFFVYYESMKRKLYFVYYESIKREVFFSSEKTRPFLFCCK
jgi:hypothetical protein